VDVWASFDGGALLTGTRGYPDNFKFFGNITFAKDHQHYLIKNFRIRDITK